MRVKDKLDKLVHLTMKELKHSEFGEYIDFVKISCKNDIFGDSSYFNFGREVINLNPLVDNMHLMEKLKVFESPLYIFLHELGHAVDYDQDPEDFMDIRETDNLRHAATYFAIIQKDNYLAQGVYKMSPLEKRADILAEKMMKYLAGTKMFEEIKKLNDDASIGIIQEILNKTSVEEDYELVDCLNYKNFENNKDVYNIIKDNQTDWEYKTHAAFFRRGTEVELEIID